jgi:hypothetical protein
VLTSQEDDTREVDDEVLFAADEVAVVHVMNRVVRRCFLLGDDAVTGASLPRLPTGSCPRWSLTSMAANPGRASIAAVLGAATKASCPSRWRPTWSCWTGPHARRCPANEARRRRMHRPSWSG